MPIAFPPQERGPAWNWASTFGVKEITTGITNIGQPSTVFESNLFGGTDSLGGCELAALQGRQVNLKNMGLPFEQPDVPTNAQQFSPQATQVQQPGVWIPQTDWAASNRAITGVSRDSTGAVLGNCVVDLFSTGSDQIAGSLMSDSGGNFSFGNPGTGPFYIVAYKAGGTDVAGTTKNTLMPASV